MKILCLLLCLASVSFATPPPAASDAGRRLANWRWHHKATTRPHKRHTPTPTPKPSATLAPTPKPSPTATPTPTATFTPTATATPTPTATFTPTATATPTPTATFTPTATVTPTVAPGLGVTYLVTSDTVENPMPVDKLANLSVWANSRVKCVELRSSWDRIEQTKGQFYWDFLNKGVALAKEHGLKVRIAVTAGVDTPVDVCAADPVACFKIIDTNGASVNTSVPWNPTFQARWGAFLKELGARYDTDIEQIDMAGHVRRAEGYFVKTQAEQDAVEILAKDAGYPDAHTAWLTAAKWIVDQYNKYFPHASFICVTGSIWPQSDDTSMASFIDYGTKYGKRFGAATHGLRSNQPADGSLYMTLPRTIRIGAQTWGTLGDDTVEAKGAFDRAIRAGAEWMELRPADCDNPVQAANIDSVNAEMIKTR